MMSSTDEDLELELRSLPGVLSVEIRHLENGDLDVVTLVTNGQDPSNVRVMAKQIVSLYSPDGSVVVDDASTVLRPNQFKSVSVDLLSTSFDPDTGSSDVDVNFDGKIGHGHATTGPLIGGAEATLAALRSLGFDIPFYLVSVVNISTPRGWPVVVTMRSLANDSEIYGIALAENDLTSSAMATLNALHRVLPLSVKNH